MSDFIERIKTEKSELDERTSKLGNFVGTEVYRKLEYQQRDLLREQYRLMLQYSSILEQRLKLLTEKK